MLNDQIRRSVCFSQMLLLFVPERKLQQLRILCFMGQLLFLTMQKCVNGFGGCVAFPLSGCAGHHLQLIRVSQKGHGGISQQLGCIGGHRNALTQEKVQIVAFSAGNGIHKKHRHAADCRLGSTQASGFRQKQIGTVQQQRHIIHHTMDMDTGIKTKKLFQLCK